MPDGQTAGGANLARSLRAPATARWHGARESHPRFMTFSQRILAGLAGGILTGLFFGEQAAALNWVADAFVKLLQMMVLPYITVSIVVSLGSLEYAQIRTLGLRAAAVIGGLWLIALGIRVPDPAHVSRDPERLVLQLEPPRAKTAVQLCRPLHPRQPVFLAGEQRRAGGGAVLGDSRRRARRRRAQAAAARRAPGRPRRHLESHTLRDPPHALWIVCGGGKRGGDAER